MCSVEMYSAFVDSIMRYYSMETGEVSGKCLYTVDFAVVAGLVLFPEIGILRKLYGTIHDPNGPGEKLYATIQI